MAFKFNNEVKIGLLVIISVIVFFVGFNYLKGRGIFNTDQEFYAKYDNVQGLQPSNLVILHGYQVGKIKEIKMLPDLTFLVTLSLRKDVQLPKGTAAQMQTGDLLSAGNKNIELVLGDGNTMLHAKDTLPSSSASGLLDGLSSQVGPTMEIVKGVLSSVDTLVKSVNTIMSTATKEHIQHSVEEMDATMANLRSLTTNINGQTAALGSIMSNVNSITGNLKNSNAKLTSTLDNFNMASKQIADAPISETMNNLKATTEKINQVLAKVNSKDGSLGMLINDKTLYNNLSNLSNTLDTLMGDLKKHPSRYVNLSVFGGKKEK